MFGLKQEEINKIKVVLKKMVLKNLLFLVPEQKEILKISVILI